MIPVEFTGRVNNPFHLPEWHPIHLLVQVFEVRLYLRVIVGIVFVATFVEYPPGRNLRLQN